MCAGKEIAEIQRQGKLVPSEITVELLRKAIGSLSMCSVLGVWLIGVVLVV
jgi:adenylate kinase family enzyme